MLVVAVDESAKNARIRTRRALSKFLPQIGSGTWMGHLSMEGLGELRAALNEKASKNTAVCCFIVRSARRYDIAWFVGSRIDWNELGWFCYRTKGVLSKTE